MLTEFKSEIDGTATDGCTFEGSISIRIVMRAAGQAPCGSAVRITSDVAVACRHRWRVLLYSLSEYEGEAGEGHQKMSNQIHNWLERYLKFDSATRDCCRPNTERFRMEIQKQMEDEEMSVQGFFGHISCTIGP